jgi:hypothetical protein
MSGDAGYYRTWFRKFRNSRPKNIADILVKGLADGEVQVLKSKALDSQGPNLAAR